MNVYEIIPNDSHKSFYGKALVFEANGKKILKSYETFVAFIDEKGKIHRTWNGYSLTTSRHIQAFFGKGISKKDWLEMDVESVPNFYN